MRILIVDADPAVADVLANAVATLGHEAAVANRGLDALIFCNARPVDALFLDIDLPDLHGIEVLRRLRRTHPKLPVVILSGGALLDEVAEARWLGVAAILKKPWVLAKLTQALTAPES